MSILLRYFTRRAWVANRADPTSVIEWKSRGGRLSLVDCTWALSAKLTLFGRTWETIDNRVFRALFDRLEAADFARELAYDEDPMGRGESYR